MQITEIDAFLVEGRPHCFINVHTDTGIVGVGEADAPGMERATHGAVYDLGSHIVGRDPRNVEGLWDRMYNGAAWNWGPVSMTALSGLEMALWDIAGKDAGVRVCDLFGGPMRERIKVYANGVIGGSPAEAATAAQSILDRGYDVTKFMPFADAAGDAAWPSREIRQRGVDRLSAVRDAVGMDLEIGVELHGVHPPQVAIELAQLVEPFDPLFIEEPVPPENIDAMRRLRDRVTLPIATGERLLSIFDYRDFFEHPTPADIVQPDVNNCGGISQLHKIAAMAQAEYIPIAPHNSRGPVATAAAAHVCAVVPNFLILEYFPDLPANRQALIAGAERVENGFYHLPDGPGLGVELNDDAMVPYDPPERTDSTYTRGYRDLWA